LWLIWGLTSEPWDPWLSRLLTHQLYRCWRVCESH
jgi:hypothetical protein